MATYYHNDPVKLLLLRETLQLGLTYLDERAEMFKASIETSATKD